VDPPCLTLLERLVVCWRRSRTEPQAPCSRGRTFLYHSPSRPRRPCVVAMAARRSTGTARRSPSTPADGRGGWSGTRRSTATAWSLRFCSWSDASNNESLQQGKAGWIHNPVSAYIVARDKKLVTADGLNHHRSLAGPAGRHETDVPRSIGIWKFSKRIEAGEGVDPVSPRQAGGLTTNTSCQAPPSTSRSTRTFRTIRC